MTRQEHLLTILIEECAEVQQRATKCLRFGVTEVQPVDTGGDGKTDNRERLTEEVNHLVAMLEMCEEDGILPDCKDPAEMERCLAQQELKKAKVERFLRYSAHCGTLTDGSRPAPRDQHLGATEPV